MGRPRLAVCLITAFAVLLPASAGADYAFVREWGRNGSGPGQFHVPEQVATDPGGHVYVVDGGNPPRVEKFDSGGNFLAEWGSYGTGNGQFENPRGIATDPAGDVYVADPVVNGGGVLPARIEKFDSNGTFLTSWPLADFAPGEPVDPGYIASDPAGDVYIAESGYASSGTVTDSRIEKFDSSGNLLTSWGSLGSGPGQFDAPWGVATDAAGDVYVVDSRNYRVEEFDSSGNFIRQWGSRGKTNGQFEGPEGVATDNAGHVLVSDDGGHGVESSVQVFTANGQFLSKFYPRDFPTGVATDSAGDVFVASCCIDHSHRIQMFAPVPPPVLGKSVDASVLSGRVKVKVRGSSQFKPLKEETRLPVGSLLDTKKGEVELTSALNKSASKTAEGDFSKGIFKVAQRMGGQHYTVAKLLGGPGSCRARRGLPKHGHGNSLYGHSHGHYGTKGHHGSGSVPGGMSTKTYSISTAGETDWLTSELCEGTYFKVDKGVLRVRDFTRHRTVTLHAGVHYLAPAHR